MMVQASFAWPDVPEKGMSSHYCQYSVIQWNFISVTNVIVTRKNVIAKLFRAGVTGRLTTTTKDWGEPLPRSI